MSSTTPRQYYDYWQLRFELPETLDRDKTPFEVFRQFENTQHVQQFPRQFPMVAGHEIEYRGYLWKVAAVRAVAKEPSSKRKGIVPVVTLRFSGILV